MGMLWAGSLKVPVNIDEHEATEAVMNRCIVRHRFERQSSCVWQVIVWRSMRHDPAERSESLITWHSRSKFSRLYQHSERVAMQRLELELLGF